MTRRRRLVFALAAIGLAFFATVSVVLAVDIYLHGRFERSAGYNVWGYRGPSVADKRAGEARVTMLGGSAAYGYGLTWDEAIPAQLERELKARPGLPPTSVVNLGYNNEGAYSFRYTLEDYLWLDYDVALLYEGYNDVPFNPPDANTQVFRHESPVYRLTGYLPIFPMIFREKAAVLRYGGAVGEAYTLGEKAVFRPGLAARGAAGVLNAAAIAGQALERQLAGVTSAPPRAIPLDTSTGCEHPWPPYCRSVLVAVEFALAHGKQVLVIGQPFFPPNNKRSERHLHQQQELATMLRQKFAGNPRVGYVALGSIVDLSDESQSFDEMHLTAAGNRIVAAALAGPVAQMLISVTPEAR